MVSFLLTILLCAYSFSATAAEGKTPAKTAAAQLAHFADKVDPERTVDTALRVHITSSAALIKQSSNPELRKEIDFRAAQKALLLIEANANVSQQNSNNITPFDMAFDSQSTAPQMFEVLNAWREIEKERTVNTVLTRRAKKANKAANTSAQDAKIAKHQNLLMRYRPQTGISGN